MEDVDDDLIQKMTYPMVRVVKEMK